MNISGLLFLLLGISVQLCHREWTLDYPLYYPEFWLPALPGWSVWMDSNHRPRAYQARALTTWATNRYSVLILSIIPVLSLFCWRDAFKLRLKAWWRWWDSNPWPPACRAGALPTELHPHTTGSFLFKDRSGPWKLNNKRSVLNLLCTDLVLTRMTESWHSVPVSIERRWSSRTFRYGYLVTT